MVKGYRADRVELVQIVAVGVIVTMPRDYVEGAVILLVLESFALEAIYDCPFSWIVRVGS